MIAGWSLALVGALIAYGCAAADGALLALGSESVLPPGLRALHDRRERTHRALAFARVMAQLAAGTGAAMALDLKNDTMQGALLKGSLAALLVVGFSESFARSRGTVRGLATSPGLLSFVEVIETLLAPVASLGGRLDHFIQRTLPRATTGDDDIEETAEQFRQVVASEAEVSKDQEVLLNGVFRLGQTTVHELMVPRVDIVAIDRDAPWSEAVDRARSSEHARLPVFVDSIDNIVGILFAKDLLPSVAADEVPEDWTTLMRPPVFIPAGKTADAQLREFQASGMHIAIVADEFGGTAGLITIEDVLEEIVGDIRDEYDEDEARVESEADEKFWVSARMTLDELSELIRHDFRRDDVSTIGGLVYEILGRVPRNGEELDLDGFRLVVERVVRRRITRVYIERPTDVPVDEDEL